MNLLFRIWAIFTVSIKRLWAQKGLTLATLTGLTAGVAIIMAVPLYADAVNFRVLQEELSSQAERTRRPPFSYLYDYIGAWNGGLVWDDVMAADAYLREVGGQSLGMPLTEFVAFFETDTYRVYPANVVTTDSEAEGYDEESTFGFFSFAIVDDFQDHVTITAGRFPEPAAADPASAIEILVSDAAGAEMGLQVGDELTVFNLRDEDAAIRELPVRISGFWGPTDDEDSYWFLTPKTLESRFIVAEETYRNRLHQDIPAPMYRAMWYLIMDGSGVTTDDVGGISASAAAMLRRAEALLPGIRNPISPVDGFQAYRRAVGKLTVLLAAFNVPVIALIVAFIILIVGMAVDQRRNEIAMMRSRGATPWQIVGFALVEGIVLGLAALILGTLLALVLTQLMGKTRTFLDFSATSTLRVALNQSGLRAGLLAVGLAVIAQVAPTLAASRDTIISYKQVQARTVRRPWWQRAWLDVILFGVALYGFYLLRQQGTIQVAGAEAGSDPFQNPLLFLLPALTAFSLTLLFLRVFPWMMEGLSWILNKSDSVGLLLGSRQLARTPRAYAMPLILLVLTVSLAAFTASLAQTLDFQLSDNAFYRMGADVRLRGPGIDFTPPAAVGMPSEVSGGLFLPMDEYLTFPGVESATRVGRYAAKTVVGGNRVQGAYLGIDRADFAESGFWRDDFADERLGTLQNALAVAPEGLLVSSDFMRQRGLRPGDLFRLTVAVGEGEVELDAQIVGELNYFPTWYGTEDGPLFVGNLETVFALTGGEMPYEVWLDTDGPPDKTAIDTALLERRLLGWNWREPYTHIARELNRPERQGLFGQLSIGFITAALLTVLGFFMYALFSFRQRFVTLGILRAVGMSTVQMVTLIAFELAALILSGLTLGTLFGIWISELFIPYLQVGDRAVDLIPPYLVQIAWPEIYRIYGLFLLLFVVALLVLVLLLRRMKIFQAIKLGETI